MKANTTKIRNKKAIQETATTNFLILLDQVVRKAGPVKSLQEFGTLVGMSQQNLSPILKRKRNVPMEACVMACDIFGCSYQWMFANKGDMFGKEKAVNLALNLEERIALIEKKLKIKK